MKGFALPHRLKERIQLILDEIQDVLDRVPPKPIEELVEAICKAEKIFLYGQGRTGHVTRSFAVRLMHLGLKVHFVGETTTPPISSRDLCIVNSGTGETRFVYHVAVAAKEAGACLATITSRPTARIGALADIVAEIPAPTKGQPFGPSASRQPAGSLFEQTAMIIMEAIVLMLIDRLGQTPLSLLQRHTNIE